MVNNFPLKMERYQVSSAGYNDVFMHENTRKGVCVADDMINKVVSINEKGQINTEDFIEVTDELYCIAGHQESGRVVYAGDGNKAFTATVDTLPEAKVFTEYLGKVWDIALDQAGIRACLVGNDKNPVIFNFETNKRLVFDASTPCALISCSWSPDSSHFATVGNNAMLTLYSVDPDFTEIKQIKQLKISEKDFKEECQHGFNPVFVDDKTLICAGKECLQVISKQGDDWKYSISTKIKHQQQIYHVALLRNNFIVTVGQDKKLNIWNLAIELKLRSFDINYKITRIQFLHSQDTMVIMDDQGQVFTVNKAVQAVQASAQVEEETRVEDSNISLPQNEETTEVEPVRVQNRMDEESKPVQTPKIIEEESRSRYQLEEEVPQQDNPIANRKKQLVYDEADEVDMRRNAGLLDDMESRYDSRTNNRAYGKIRREENPPQPAFNPGSTTGSGEARSRRYMLCYNMFGKVTSRQASDKHRLIEVEYSLGSLSRRGMIDDRDFDMASINYRGALIASQGEIKTEDEYENELKDEAEKASTLRFLSADSKSDWEVVMGPQENIQSIALGLHCAAAFTNRQIIRIFAPDGIETQVFGFSRPVVGMSLYENLLAIIYHAAAPFSGKQTLRLQIMNLSNREAVEDRDIVISPESKLKWYGFSEEGIFYIQDSKFMLWGQQSASIWAPVFDGLKESNMWVIGVSDQTIIYLKLPYGEHEPSAFINYTPSNIGFRPPFVKEEGKARFLELLKLDQGRLRLANFSNMRSSGIYDQVQKDPMTLARDTVPNEDDLDKQALEVDKQTLERARLALVQGNHEAAIYYGLQLEATRTLNVCMRLFESMGHSKLAERLKLESDKIGNVQYRLRQGATKQYVPQLVIQTAAPEIDFGAKENKGQLEFNSIKLNKASFSDAIDDQKPAASAKVKASESSKEEERPKKKPNTTHDLFRDFSEMAKTKR